MSFSKNALLAGASYLLLIVAINYGFKYAPMMDIAGEIIPSMSFAVGVIFLLRDVVQRYWGHYVIVLMLIASAMSFFLAAPQIAFASLTAFAVSEFCDWGVYSITKRPFSQRLLISSVVSTPIDSAVFLYLAGFGSPLAVAIMTACKLVVAFAVWWAVRRSEQRELGALNAAQ